MVADAVRSLAQRSASSAKEINTMIQNMGDRMQEGSAIISNSEKTFSTIVERTTQVSELVDSIATSSRDQSIAINEVNRTLQEIDSLSQNNAQAANDNSMRANELATYSTSLERNVDLMDYLIKGEKNANGSVKASALAKVKSPSEAVKTKNDHQEAA